jgi:predicted ABC-type ATPase
MGLKHQNRVLVNIRGCNGAGKSTIPMSMMNDPDMFVEELRYGDGKKVASFTVFPNYGWIALGTYFNKTGGLDTIKGNERIKTVLYAAIGMYPEYDIIMEGIICSTVFSSNSELFHEIEEEAGLQVLILTLVPPFEECLKRIQLRNGGKPINELLVKNKYGSVIRSHEKFKSEGFTCVKVNTSKVTKVAMLDSFLKTVRKHRR